MDYEDGIATIPGNVKPGQDVYMIDGRNKSEVSRRWVTQIIIDGENNDPKIYVRRHGYFTKRDLGVKIFLTPQGAFNALAAKGYLTREEAKEKGEARAIGDIIKAMIRKKYGDHALNTRKCAEKAGLLEKVVCSIVEGRQKYTAEDLVQLTTHLGTTIEEVKKMAEGGDE